jgi:hypothetical protein
MEIHWVMQNDGVFTPGDTYMHGRYTVVREIGRGAQGAAILVRDNHLKVE